MKLEILELAHPNQTPENTRILNKVTEDLSAS